MPPASISSIGDSTAPARSTVAEGDIQPYPEDAPQLRRGYFHYDNLVEGQIRLLKLHGKDQDGILHGQLIPVNLDAAPPFFALSYMWSDITPARHVVINQKTMIIRANLYEFLSTRSATEMQQPLWCDAISMDQSHLVERNKQVAMMADIYRRAERVLVWLGPSSQTLISYFHRAEQDYLQQHDRSQHDEIQRVPAPLAKSQITALHLLAYGAWLNTVRSVFQQALHQALEDLVSAPIWRRTWICLEVVQAKELSIISGAWHVSWSYLRVILFMERVWKAKEQPGRVAWEAAYERSMFRRLHEQRRQCLDPTSQELDLRTVLETYGDTNCQDPRDKIYALQGLTSDSSAGKVVPVDYTCSPARLFLNVLLLIKPPDLAKFGHLLRRVLGIRYGEAKKLARPQDAHRTVVPELQRDQWSISVDMDYIGLVNHADSDPVKVVAYAFVDSMESVYIAEPPKKGSGIRKTSPTAHLIRMRECIGNRPFERGDLLFRFCDSFLSLSFRWVVTKKSFQRVLVPTGVHIIDPTEKPIETTFKDYRMFTARDYADSWERNVNPDLGLGRDNYAHFSNLRPKIISKSQAENVSSKTYSARVKVSAAQAVEIIFARWPL